jgi:hypothetical protein
MRPASSAPASVAPSAAHPHAAAHVGGEPAASQADARESSYEPPLGPREPERTNWWFVVAVNLVIFAGMLAGLWFSGFFPPPSSHP